MRDRADVVIAGASGVVVARWLAGGFSVVRLQQGAWPDRSELDA